MDTQLACAIERSLDSIKREAIYVKDGKAVFDTITARGILCDNIEPIFGTLLKTYSQGIPPGVKRSIEKLRDRIDKTEDKVVLQDAQLKRAAKCFQKMLTLAGVAPEKIAEIMLALAKERD